MFIDLTPTTTPDQAILMAFEFATALRATGWPEQDIDYARGLWVGTEYKGNSLTPYLEAGFTAGYLGERRPQAKDVPANDLEVPFAGLPDEERRSAVGL
jgi:hypothetical protein